MTNTQKNQDTRKQQNDTNERDKDGGRFEKGSDRAREAGRKGGKSS
jgi:general stress protein YciG